MKRGAAIGRLSVFVMALLLSWLPTSLPKLGKVKVVVGEPIEFSELESLTEQQMADYVGEKLAVCYNEAKEWNQN